MRLKFRYFIIPVLLTSSANDEFICGAAMEGTGPGKRSQCYNVIELPDTHLSHQRAHCIAFKLEDPSHPVTLEDVKCLLLCQVYGVKHLWVYPNLLTAVVNDRERLETQSVNLQ